jgi:ribosome-associated protein
MIDDEIELNFVRSSGSGGQNVNKVSSKVQLKWNIDNSFIFSEFQKNKIKKFLKNKINKDGFLVLESEEYREQFKNRELVVEKLKTLIRTALFEEKTRRITKPTRASKEKRIKEKKEKSEKKQNRKIPKKDW